MNRVCACTGGVGHRRHVRQRYEFRSRWVERVGNTDVVISGDALPLDGMPRRIRLQFAERLGHNSYLLRGSPS